MQVVDVADETISIRSLDWDRDRFDIEFGLQEGTTYNSYLIFGDKTALVDASHEKFRGLYMKTLKDQLSAQGRSLDYVIVSHTEPDHSGMRPALLMRFSLALHLPAVTYSQRGVSHLFHRQRTHHVMLWRIRGLQRAVCVLQAWNTLTTLTGMLDETHWDLVFCYV